MFGLSWEMKVVHHGIEIVDLPEEWLAEASMLTFVPNSSSYRADPEICSGQAVFEVRIDEVAPFKRSPGVPIFNRDSETGSTARERVVSILRGFQMGAALPPISVVALEPEASYKYKLVAGVHRFYCSLAVGFTSVPAITGFDWSTLDK